MELVIRGATVVSCGGRGPDRRLCELMMLLLVLDMTGRRRTGSSQRPFACLQGDARRGEGREGGLQRASEREERDTVKPATYSGHSRSQIVVVGSGGE